MLTYPHIEDYLELLAGYDPADSIKYIFPTKQFKFSLARYDVQIVDSMAAHTIYGTALTDKQGELVLKLIQKYKRQFNKYDIDISLVDDPIFRLPLRKIDRSKKIWVEDDGIKIKFPFDDKHIQDLRWLRENGQGSGAWNNQTKLWTFGLTEYTINYLCSWGISNGFEVDPEMSDLFRKIVECESQPYEIKLVNIDGKYTVINASTSLLDYINTYVGDDLIRLVDHAGVLGYSVDADILQQCSQRYGSALEYVGTRHTTHIQPMSDPTMWEWLLDYAELTQRYPICIYDPGMIDLDLSRFEYKDVVRFDRNGKTSTSEYDPYNVKVVYAQAIPRSWDFPVPLLVTTVEMMFGGTKLTWLNKAEKIVYWTNTILKEKN